MKRTDAKTSSTTDVANWEIFLWALSSLGGSTTFVEVEDVFLECFKLAPKRFSWRTKPDIPDYKKCSKALRDAEDRKPRLLVKTRVPYSRQLTVEGQRWIKAESKRLGQTLSGKQIVKEPATRPNARLLAGIEKSDSFSAWMEKRELPPEKWRIAELFHCSPDSASDLWSSRLEVLRGHAFAAGNEEVLHFLEAIEKQHPEWFHGRHV